LYKSLFVSFTFGKGNDTQSPSDKPCVPVIKVYPFHTSLDGYTATFVKLKDVVVEPLNFVNIRILWSVGENRLLFNLPIFGITRLFEFGTCTTGVGLKINSTFL
jgi:hypothetical protein